MSTLSTQLSWSRILEILVIKDELARKFYAEMCRLERWSVRTLRGKINGMLLTNPQISDLTNGTAWETLLFWQPDA